MLAESVSWFRRKLESRKCFLMLANENQKAVLLRLHDQLDELKAELSASEIAESFTSKLDPLAVEDALSSLVNSGLVLTVQNSPTHYRVSRAGITEVENTHSISTTTNPSTGIVHRSYSERQHPSGYQSSINWQMWGVILTAVAIFVTILIAVIF
ncbi:hypothetical protein SPHINGOR109_10704 [Sphingorhabdus sp. 109]|nr:hypothetical protein SPHINGOR109_10704 [Sphingorhabdus sp. 109]